MASEPCRYFLAGNCSYGSRCRNSHQAPQSGFGGQRPQSTFGLRPATAQSSAFASASGTAGRQPQSVDMARDIQALQSDLSKEKPLWQLSCYALQKESPRNIISGTDVSQDEARWIYYELRNRNMLPAYVESWNRFQASMSNRIQEALRDPAGSIATSTRPYSTGETPPQTDVLVANGILQAICGTASGAAQRGQQQQPPVSAFGSIVGAAGQQQPGLATTSAFAQPSQPTSAFGQPPQAASVFGQQPVSAFGHAARPVSAFGQPARLATTSAFGQPAQQTLSAFGQPSQRQASAFGQPARPQSAFGQAAPARPSSAFGQPSQPSTAFGQPTRPSSAFGQQSLPAPTFGQPSPSPSQPVSAFGQPGRPTSAFGQASLPTPTFGRPAQPTSAFGQPSQPPSVFGQPSRPTSAFGQSTAQPASASGGLGSTARPPASAFGQSASSAFGAAAGSAFGARPAAPSSAFGSSARQPTSAFGAGSAFGSAFAQPQRDYVGDLVAVEFTEEDKKAFEVEKFVAGSVPLKPPTAVMCR